MLSTMDMDGVCACRSCRHWTWTTSEACVDAVDNGHGRRLRRVLMLSTMDIDGVCGVSKLSTLDMDDV